MVPEEPQSSLAISVSPIAADAAELPFTGAQLRASIPIHLERGLKGQQGAALVADIGKRVYDLEGRTRALKRTDALPREKTIEMLLANLAVASLNRIDRTSFVAMSLSSNDYANTGLSFTSMKLLFDALQQLGLAEGVKGVAKLDALGERRGMRSRLRATTALNELMKHHGVTAHHIRHPLEVIRMKKSTWRTGAEPAEITSSRAVLLGTNSLLAETDIHAPEQVWADAQLEARTYVPTEQQRMHRKHYGDMSAKCLYRVFNERWDRGGRLYGGWWMGVSKVGRRLIAIDGSPTVELDYGQLHPTMLFAKVGKRLDYDPYQFGPFSRELGKDTFMRLLNRSSLSGGRYLKRAGRVPLPAGISMAEYAELYKQHLAPVRELLGEGMGLSLQREDSDLALSVLGQLLPRGIVTLPVHDSFIVKVQNEATLKAVMISSFSDRYGFEPVIK
ncbi:MAG: hypothetical protein V4530_08095 [Pseudomonadota bacterium]